MRSIFSCGLLVVLPGAWGPELEEQGEVKTLVQASSEREVTQDISTCCASEAGPVGVPSAQALLLCYFRCPVLPYTQAQVRVSKAEASCLQGRVCVTGAPSSGTHRDLRSQLQGMAQAPGEPRRVGAVRPQRAHVGSRNQQPAPRGATAALERASDPMGPSQDAVGLAQAGLEGTGGWVGLPRRPWIFLSRVQSGKQSSGSLPASVRGCHRSERSQGDTWDMLPGMRTHNPIYQTCPCWGRALV